MTNFPALYYNYNKISFTKNYFKVMDKEENELATEFSSDAQAEVKALKAMHMELSEVKDPVEKKRLKTEILKKVKLLEDLLHQKKDHQSSTPSTPSPPPPSGSQRSSGILTTDDFDFDDKDEIIIPMKSTTAKSVIDEDDLEANGDKEHEGIKPLMTFDWDKESEKDTTEDKIEHETSTTPTSTKPSTTEEHIAKEKTTEVIDTITDVLDPNDAMSDIITLNDSETTDVTEKTDDKLSEDNDGEEGMFYPWESPLCEDTVENCESWKPFCKINPISSYFSCRKTCKMCIKHHPKPMSKLKLTKCGNLGIFLSLRFYVKSIVPNCHFEFRYFDNS